jgi:hypothetical protein
MRQMKRLFLSTKKRFQQRGSALLASLMVIVGLSLLGLAFVAISETESAISINERNHSQTVALAEAAARVCVQWFQNPQQMRSLGLLPLNNTGGATPGPMTVLKTQRVVGGTPIGSNNGYYKGSASELLCDLPFGPLPNDEFFGPEDSADLIINGSTPEGQTFLNTFNDGVFGLEPANASRAAGEITEIRIYAPPIAGPTLTPAAPPHFYVGGTRYGVATIMARAEKFDRPRTQTGRRSLARAECRIVVSQFPLPAPGGPLQSATDLGTNGNFNVHWGLVSAQQTLDLKKDYVALPWFNAYERIHFNRGYDSSVQWTQNRLLRSGDIVRPTPAAIALNGTLAIHSYSAVTNPPSGVDTSTSTEPAWPVSAGGTVTQSGAPLAAGASITYTERTTTAYPLSQGGAPSATNTPWLYYIARGDVQIEDPWFHARSAQDIKGDPTANAQPYAFDFSNPTQFLQTGGCCGPGYPTHHFQYQNFDQYPNFKNLLFPIISYDFWKAAAIAGNGQSGVKYLQWVAADTYTDGINTKTFQAWATSQLGYYFFDTQNSQNPQQGGPGVLAPQVAVNGSTAYMGTFIYLNAPFATTGLTGPNGKFCQPGEPFMDIGYRQVETATGAATPQGDFVRDAAGVPVVKFAVNNEWDYQDLPWSNSGATNGAAPGANGKFDVFVASRLVHDPSDSGNPTSTYTGWFPVPYTPNCKPGNNTCGGCNCSEPHEPYLNIKYDGASLTNLTVGWFDPGTAVTSRRLPKRTIDPATGLPPGGRTDTPVTCTEASSPDDCTGNHYDLDGALVPLAPSTDGVFYTEGLFDSKGNADYYGSVLVGGGVDSQGTPNLWYDESLSRGIRLRGFPRVMVTSIETDR